MPISRRDLPPTSVLCAFEAAARLGSFTASGAELHLTQSAISRQIRALEDMLGAALFIRERQMVRLTQAGEAYATEIRPALQRISQATLELRASPRGGTLNLAVLPTFGTRWLAPRLPRFLSAHPEITLNLTTRLVPFDFSAEALDAAIHFGAPVWAGAELDELLRETVVPTCSPAFKEKHKFVNASDFLEVPLLHVSSRPHAWKRWFATLGVAADTVPGMSVDQFALAAQAASAGLGVSLLPQFLIVDEIARGDLVEAFSAAVQSDEKYHLAFPSAKSGYPPLEAFRAWLREETGNAISAKSRKSGAGLQVP